MGKIKSEHVFLVFALVALLCFGLPVWFLSQFIGTGMILSLFGSFPYLAAALISGVLLGSAYLVGHWLQPKLPGSLKYAYRVFFVYFLVVSSSILPATFLVNKGLPSVRQVSFNEAAWKADTYTNNTFPKRVNMVESLKKDHLKIGMTRNEVEQLLGDCSKYDDNKCTFYLGPQRDSIFAIDSSLLTLHFTGDRLTSFEEWSD